MSAQSERLLRAVGEIDEELARDAAPLKALPRKRPRRKVLWLAAAAALAVLLSGTALAAANGGFGIWTVPVQKDEGYYRQMLSTSVKYFTAQDFGPSVRTSPDGLYQWNEKLDSLREVEDYLGYPIPQNALLDRGEPMPGDSGCTVTVCYHTGSSPAFDEALGLWSLSFSSTTVIDGIAVNMSAKFAIDEIDDYPNGVEFPEGYTVQERTLPNGVKALLVLPPEGMEPDPQAYRTVPSAHFVYEGACYELYMWGAQAMQAKPSQEIPDLALDWEGVFYRVLDAFE